MSPLLFSHYLNPITRNNVAGANVSLEEEKKGKKEAYSGLGYTAEM